MGCRTENNRPDNLQKRRTFLSAGLSAGSASLLAAAAFSETAQAQRGPNSPVDRSATSAGPENHLLESLNPNSLSPPATDQGDAPGFWYSFSLAPRRIFAGGWSRQVAMADFPLAKEMAGVNLRLSAGGIRGQHWSSAAEWGFVLSGNARLAAVDPAGGSYRKDLGPGDVWYFPAGTPHSIQGLDPDGCGVLLVFDSGGYSETSVSELSDWLRHTPREALAKSLGVAEADVEPLYKTQNPLPIFPGTVDSASPAASIPRGSAPHAFDISLKTIQPVRKVVATELKIVDSEKFPVASSISAAHVIVRPGGLREMHWHPDADEWQYFLQGKGRMTVFFNSGRARTADFNAGDIGYVPKSLGHYVQNTGSTDLIFLEILRANRFREVSLTDWISNTPPDLVTHHLGISRDTLNAILKQRP